MANGRYVTDNGSVLVFQDVYSRMGTLLRISRTVTVEKADPRDLGFSTKIFFYQAQSQELTDYEYFSPGQWYLNNEYAGPQCLGKQMDLQYYYRKETYSGLLRGRYRWLPWCTFVEVDPSSRMYDTFGVYEIADAERLPLEERLSRNDIYKDICP